MKRNFGFIIIGFVIVAIILLYASAFTVRWQEKALVLTFGKISRQVDQAGLKWKWPAPIQTVVKFDGRIRTLQKKPVETTTSDKQNIIVSVYVNWRIVDPKIFYKRFRTSDTATGEDVILNAEDKLENWIAEAANVFAEYNFSQLVTLDTEKFKLDEVEGSRDDNTGMLARLSAAAEIKADYGIEIIDLGIRRLGVPKLVTERVFKRMENERNSRVITLMADGSSRAQSIEADAKSRAKIITTNAAARAREIEGQGDSEAAQYYARYLKNTQLANFLRKLETLRKTLSKRTTLVIDSQTPPYQLLNSGPGIFEPDKKTSEQK